jgi:hypothetical protein
VTTVEKYLQENGIKKTSMLSVAQDLCMVLSPPSPRHLS